MTYRKDIREKQKQKQSDVATLLQKLAKV